MAALEGVVDHGEEGSKAVMQWCFGHVVPVI